MKEPRGVGVPVQYIVYRLAHDVVDALQVVVQLPHVRRGVGIDVVLPLPLNHAICERYISQYISEYRLQYILRYASCTVQ